MARMIINPFTKQLSKYDFHTIYMWEGSPYAKREALEANVFYVNFRYEFLERSKSGLKVVAYNPESDQQHRVYLFYTNDGNTLLKEYHTYCGYDRGPKFNRVVDDLFAKI